MKKEDIINMLKDTEEEWHSSNPWDEEFHSILYDVLADMLMERYTMNNREVLPDDNELTGVAKLKLSLTSALVSKPETEYTECKLNTVDEVTCCATLSDNELKDTSRVLYLVSRLYQNLISEVSVKGMCGEGNESNNL